MKGRELQHGQHGLTTLSGVNLSQIMRLSQTTGSVTTCLSNSIESAGSADRKDIPEWQPRAPPPLPPLLRARARAPTTYHYRPALQDSESFSQPALPF